MAYVPIPKDLSNVKTKVLLNLTKRQLVCFGLGALVGIPVFYVMQLGGNMSNSIFMMILTMFPFFMFGMYEQHNQPLEVILKNYLMVKFITPKHRPYQTNNFYNLLKRQATLDKEVGIIVKKNKANARRTQANSESNSKGKQ